MNLYLLAGALGLTIFLYVFYHEKWMAEEHPFLLDMAANVVVAILFILIFRWAGKSSQE
jgi:hypothetical protein